MRSGIISFVFYSVLRERVERHSQCARGLWVRVDTRRLEDVRKGRASETGQLHGSRGRCPRAREVPALFRNSDSTVSFLSSAFCRRHRSPRSNHEGGHVPEEDARRGVQARLARVWSRARILPGPNRSSRDPHDPNHRHRCDTCRLSSAAFRLHHKIMWPPHRRQSYFLSTKKRESSFSHRVSFPDVVSCRDKNKTAPARSS